MNGNKRIGLVVQERDRRLLRELGHVRVIGREQAKVLGGFSSTTRVNTRLLALTRVGLLKRFFLGTRAGGAKALYSLSPKGAKFIGVPDRGPQRRNDTALVGDLFVEHQLAVNDIYCAFKTESLPGVAFRRWVAFFEPIAQGVRLIPDGYVEFETPSGIFGAFLEVDLGSESLKVWKDKVKTYLTYAVSGTFEKQFGLTRFRVLVVAHSERRMQSIRRVVGETTDKIFWFQNFESIERDGLLAPRWLRPRGEYRLPLIKELP